MGINERAVAISGGQNCRSECLWGGVGWDVIDEDREKANMLFISFYMLCEGCPSA